MTSFSIIFQAQRSFLLKETRAKRNWYSIQRYFQCVFSTGVTSRVYIDYYWHRIYWYLCFSSQFLAASVLSLSPLWSSDASKKLIYHWSSVTLGPYFHLLLLPFFSKGVEISCCNSARLWYNKKTVPLLPLLWISVVWTVTLYICWCCCMLSLFGCVSLRLVSEIANGGQCRWLRHADNSIHFMIIMRWSYPWPYQVSYQPHVGHSSLTASQVYVWQQRESHNFFLR